MKNDIILDPFSKFDIIKELEEHDAIFKALVSIGKIYFSEEYSTAWVTFDSDGNFLNFYFNPKFWEKLSLKDKVFVISHECLHVLLKHGLRLKDLEDKELAHIAADLVVNHLLIDKFSIDLENKDLKSRICLIQNIDSNNILSKSKKTLTAEEYYSILTKNKNKLKLSSLINLHQSEFDFGFDSEKRIDEKNNQKNNEKLVKEITNEDINNLLEKIFHSEKINEFVKKTGKELYNSFNTYYGPNPFAYSRPIIFNNKSKENMKWKKYFLNIIKSSTKIEEKECLQWIKKNRRNTLPSHLILPHSVELEKKKRDKFRVQVYIDFSDSCRNLRKKFWDICSSIPKKEFDVDLFTVSDYVLPIVNNKLSGTMGNAPFQIIEENIQNMLKEKKIKKYPDSVVVITDGKAGPVKPAFPEKWLWILPTDSMTCSIPKLSKIIYLDE